MEVHKHLHDITHKKKWPEYLLEFLMLFLAVFLGFVAENKREDIVNAKKEKFYMQSMADDLKKDTANLNLFIRLSQVQMNYQDKMIQIIQQVKLNDSLTKLLYQYNLHSLGTVQITLTDRTDSQLKNSGGLSLIKNTAVVKNLFEYWSGADDIKNFSSNLNELRLLAREKSYSIFNSKYYVSLENDNGLADFDKQVLMTTDFSILTEFANRLNHLRNINRHQYLPGLKREFSLAVNLIAQIKKEYHLENE